MSDRKALHRRARELQAQEWRRQIDAGAEAIDHEAADERVLQALEGDGTWTKTALSFVVGPARGAERQAQGPEVRHTNGTMSLWKSPDVLVPLGDDESQYLGVLVRRKDAARVNGAIRYYESQHRDDLARANASAAMMAGLREILDDLLNDRDVRWDADEEGSAEAA